MKYEKELRLRGRGQSGFVCYPDGDEDAALLIRVLSVSLDGEVTLSFKGDRYKIFREEIYSKGGMRK